MGHNLTFIHGWGMDNRVWGKLLTHFPEEKIRFINLCFTNNIIPSKVEGSLHSLSVGRDDKAIYITHSLGTMWALKHHYHDMAGLITINGFTNFTDFIDKRILRSMQKHLKRNPNILMNEFWDNISLPSDLRSDNLNIDRLYEGLEWLINWDVEPELKALQVPILSLAGNKDPLLSNKMLEKQLLSTNININENGGHILPLTHPEWCANKIKEFISEFRLEK